MEREDLTPAEGLAEMAEVVESGSWQRYLDAWGLLVWPIFEKRGFSRDTALLVWTMNEVKNGVYGLEDALTEPPEGEGWRG